LVVDVDADAGPRLALVLRRDVGGAARQVADVPHRRLDHVVAAEVLLDLLGLRAGLDDHQPSRRPPVPGAGGGAGTPAAAALTAARGLRGRGLRTRRSGCDPVLLHRLRTAGQRLSRAGLPTGRPRTPPAATTGAGTPSMRGGGTGIRRNPASAHPLAVSRSSHSAAEPRRDRRAADLRPRERNHSVKTQFYPSTSATPPSRP